MPRSRARPKVFARLMLAAGIVIPFSTVHAGVQITLLSAGGGVTISGTRPTYSASLGSGNGLGVGSPGGGVTKLTAGVSDGVLYTTPYSIKVQGFNGTNTLTAHVSGNFSRSSILRLYSCPINTDCSIASNFSLMSTNAGAPTVVYPVPGVADQSTQTASLGVFISNSSGPGASAGADSATITLTGTNFNDSSTSTATLTVSFTAVTAVRLTLASAPGGLTISPATDYTVSYGNLNGLGVGSPAGLTKVSVSGGTIWATPYWLQPSFSSFSSSTGTLAAWVSLDFVHPSTLELREAAVDTGPYSTLSKLSGSPTTLTNSAPDNTNVTRYLGVWVSSANGGGAFRGSDNATITCILVVP